MLLHLALVVAGIGLLYVGGEQLVRHSVALARGLGVSPLVIGLTIVAFGTSAPELAVSVTAASAGSPEIALGNVIGSNVANIGLILGLTVTLTALPAQSRFVRREVPFMIGTAVLVLGLVTTGALTRMQAPLLFALLLAFLWMLLRSKADSEDIARDLSENRLVAFLGCLLGLALLIGGAKLMVDSAQEVARSLGISERVIALTMVAFGTSVPELAGCLIAAARKEAALVLGNIVGSNIFNTLLILPSAMAVHTIPVTFSENGVDLFVMLGLSLLLWIFLLSGDRLSRWEGWVFFSTYVAYIAYVSFA